MATLTTTSSPQQLGEGNNSSPMLATSLSSSSGALLFRLKSADMAAELQEAAEEVARAALREVQDDALETDLAKCIVREFNRRFGAHWHCVVGRNFGCSLTHLSGHFVYFYLGDLAFCLFKVG